MPQKILAGRAEDPRLEDDIVRVRVDQVILAREPNDVVRDAAEWGLKKTSVETAVAYDTRCITTGALDELDCRTLASASLRRSIWSASRRPLAWPLRTTRA